MRSITIGIDPGKSGGMAIIVWRPAYKLLRVLPFDRHEYSTVLSMYRFNDAVAYVEKVHAMPGQGVTSMFSFGENYGFIQGLLQAHQIETHYVSPKTWQHHYFFNAKGSESRERKDLLLKLAKLEFPELKYWEESTLSFQRAIADALLIAKYGRMQNGGNAQKSISKTRRTLEELRTLRTLQHS